ncbi:uridine phosphorylase [Radiobacillus kanasensis]|uniref:phosphorylase family protein n=1 Tax=Radiobacillus kanasensis TaxID=2844358 RepID=UPI001E2DC240|nr:uridine phosphorylase [Radiobacillus kanasensis]UFT98320.1 uridine phosphorylase [Radiobacillus kanasensis]
MKLYGDFTKRDWLKALDIREEQIPGAFVIHGEHEHDHNIKEWTGILKPIQWLPSWNSIVGSYEGNQIGFANVYGGPMAATVVHRFSVMGTSKWIQTGYFGGLSHEVDYGDILIVTAAEMKDGVSDWYLPNQQIVYSDEQLVNAAVRFCEENGYNYKKGTILTTGAIMVETQSMVNDWAEKGHVAVDMETATTLSVASYFGKKAIAILNLSDHLIKGDTFYHEDEERDQMEEETDRRIKELALHLATK